MKVNKRVWGEEAFTVAGLDDLKNEFIDKGIEIDYENTDYVPNSDFYNCNTMNIYLKIDPDNYIGDELDAKSYGKLKDMEIIAENFGLEVLYVDEYDAYITVDTETL